MRRPRRSVEPVPFSILNSSFYIHRGAMQHEESRYLAGRRILPEPIRKGMSAVELIDQAFLAYNGRRLREACRLFAQKMLEPDVTVGITLAGALTPAGMGLSALAPLIEAGFIDW